METEAADNSDAPTANGFRLTVLDAAETTFEATGGRCAIGTHASNDLELGDREHLQRYPRPGGAVAGAIQLAHSAATRRSLYLKTPGQNRPRVHVDRIFVRAARHAQAHCESRATT